MRILELANEMGLLKLGTVSLDGSKAKANASKHKALSWEYAQKLKARLEAEATALLEEAERTDQGEEVASVDLPAELARRQDRIEAIRQAQARINARAKERYEQEQQAYEAKVEARQKQEQATGRKAGGRTPKPPEEGPRDRDQVNLTDEESRIMPTSGGGFEQAYNVQAVVETESFAIFSFTSQSTELKPDRLLVEDSSRKAASISGTAGCADPR